MFSDNTFEIGSCFQKKSLFECFFKNTITGTSCNIERMIIFDSVARNESDRESDCDLLIITTQPRASEELGANLEL